MGIIISRIRKQKSTIEILEKLDNDIKGMEENQSNAQKKYRKIIKLLLVYSVGLYVLCGIIFYFQFTSTLKGKLLYLVISPLVLYVIIRIISWYFERLINKNQLRLYEMKKEKKRILEQVMDKETYKVAKQILEKFSSETVLKSNYNVQLAPNKQPDDRLKKRIVNTSSSFQKTHPLGNIMKSFVGNQASLPITSSPVPCRPLPGAAPSVMQFPAPILPLQQSYVHKIVEYLIGDGPNNRYALICSQCHSHNGMALKEEFEYIGFKCCYCFSFNPARKVRPEAPRLETSSKTKRQFDSDSERTSSENSDAEHKIASGNISSNAQRSLETSYLDSDVKANNTELTKKVNDEASEENASNTIGCVENFTEEAQQKQNSNETENDANCDQSLVKS